MAEFWIGVKGDLTGEQKDALGSAGIAVDELRQISGGGGIPAQWEPSITFVRVSATDEGEARQFVAQALGLEARDLFAYPTGGMLG